MVNVSNSMTLNVSRGPRRASAVRSAAFASRSDLPAIDPEVSITKITSRGTGGTPEALGAGGTSISSW